MPPPPAPPPATPTPSAPTAGAPTHSAPAKSSSGLKILFIVLAIFVGLGVLAIGAVTFGIWQFTRHVDVDTDGGKVSISTPGGEVTVGEAAADVSEADLGVPIYPGATGSEGS